MWISVRYADLQLDTEQQSRLQSLVESVLRRSLRHRADQVQGVSLQLRDVNGPRGGEDKLCLVHLQLRGAPAVVVRERGAQPVALVRQAIARAAHALLRQTERRLAAGRSAARGQTPLPDPLPLAAA